MSSSPSEPSLITCCSHLCLSPPGTNEPLNVQLWGAATFWTRSWLNGLLLSGGGLVCSCWYGASTGSQWGWSLGMMQAVTASAKPAVLRATVAWGMEALPWWMVLSQHVMFYSTISPLHHMTSWISGNYVWLLSEFKLRLFEDDEWILPLLHINVISQ